MLIIVGLGNPGKEYENTFHNMGFRVVDVLAERLNKSIKKIECKSLTVTFSRNNEKVVLAKPMTYMNLSGEAVKELMRKYKASPEELLVIYDDIDIDRFALRARAMGSAGTHNGMKSIVESIGTERFKRVRVGIGRGAGELKDYVLSAVTKEDNAVYEDIFDTLSEILVAYLKDKDFDKVMRSVNAR